MRIRILLSAALALGCQATGNRQVVEDATARALQEVLRGRSARSGSIVALTLEVERRPALPAIPASVVEADAPALEAPPLPLDVLFADGASAVDVGLPFSVDFGVGEAPYDDGTLPIHRGSVGPGGFSDSILSVIWQSPLPGGLRFQSRAAMVRPQDLAILDGLSDARFAFAVVGLAVSF